MPDALEIDKEAIKLAAVAGVPYPELARRYGLLKPNGQPDTNIIRQWAWREKWPIPRRILASARHQHKEAIKQTGKKVIEARGKMQPEVINGVTDGFNGESSARNAAVIVTDNLQELGQQGTLLASQLALRSLKRAPDSLPVTSLAEVKTAMQVVRIAAGMDSGDGPTIHLGLFGGGVSATSGAVVDIGGQAESEPGLLEDDVFS